VEKWNEKLMDDGSGNDGVARLKYKNSSGDEIANVNFYAVRPEATRLR